MNAKVSKEFIEQPEKNPRALELLQKRKPSQIDLRFNPIEGGGASRLHLIRESFIREMTRLALTYGAINLSQGFPDFDPPREVIEAAHYSLDNGGNQYTITWGTPILRQAIAAKMNRWYNLNFDPDQHITVTCGVTEAILASLMSILNTDDEAIIIEPYHEGYLPAIIFAGGKPRFVPLDPSDYSLDPVKLESVFNDRTRAIIVNSPHNPTGRVFTRAELEEIARLCIKYNVIAITDEIYEHIVYGEHIHIPLASIPGMAERTITISGFGKTFAMTGWRLGYACAPASLSTALRTVHDFMTICAPAPLQAACAAALNLSEDYYKELSMEYTQKRDIMTSILHNSGFIAKPPEGAFYIMADFSQWEFDGDDFSFARWLPANLGVAVVPGSCFYATKGMGKKIVRFAFAKKIETLRAAENRMMRR